MRLLAFIFLFFFFSSLFADRQCVVDDIQSTVCLDMPFERIISLSPHITELIYALDAGDRLVGVIQGSDYPSEAEENNVIGNFQAVSIEKIIQLQPDLIIAWPAAISARTLAQFEKFGISIYHSDPKTLSGIVENISELGKLTGKGGRASEVIKYMHQELINLQQDFKTKTNLSAVVLIADKPLMALSNKGLINEAFSLCGVENVFSELPSEAAIVNTEALLEKQPDILLTTFPFVNKKTLLSRLSVPESATVRVVELNPDLLLRQTPRFLQGVRDFCRAVQLSGLKRTPKNALNPGW